MENLIMSEITIVWLDLVDASGAIRDEARNAILRKQHNTGHLRDALLIALPSAWGLSACDLAVYGSHDDFKANEELDEDVQFPGAYGYDEHHPVVVFLKSRPPPKSPLRDGIAKALPPTELSTRDLVRADEWFADGKFQIQEMMATSTSTNTTSVRYVTMRGFPPVAHRSNERNIIMERACYVTIFDQLVEIIANPGLKMPFFKNVVIRGNPGIGKSSFYLYCIFRLALDDAVRAALPHFQLVLNYKNKYHVYDPQTRTFMSVGHDRCVLEKLRGNSHVLRLIEDDTDWVNGWRGKSVFFAAPQHPGINSFLKENGHTFIMPAWTLEELRTFNRLAQAQEVSSVSDETLVDLFRVRGGIPRSIFGTCPIQYQTLLATALNTMDAHRVVATVECNGPSDPTDEWIYDLLVMVPTRDDCATCDKWEFVSPHIASLVKEKTTGRAAREMQWAVGACTAKTTTAATTATAAKATTAAELLFQPVFKRTRQQQPNAGVWSRTQSGRYKSLLGHGQLTAADASNLSSATGSGGFSMSFGSDLSPSTFSSSMDFGLDMDGSGLGGLSYDGQDTPNGSGGGGSGGTGNDSGDGSDLMNFVEQL